MSQLTKLIAIIIIVFSIAIVLIGQFVQPLLAEHFDSISNLSKAEALGVYVVSGFLLSAFAVPGSGLVIAAAGFLFGFLYGTLVAVLVLAAGSFATFLFSRKYLREKISRKYEGEILKINAGLEKQGLKYFLFVRASPFPPVSVVNFAMGVTSISKWNFIWVSALGFIPAGLFYSYLGSKLASMAQF